MSASSRVCGKSFPQVSGSVIARSPDKTVGTPRTTIGSGAQNNAKDPTNGTQRVKTREIIEFVPIAYLRTKIKFGFMVIDNY